MYKLSNTTTRCYNQEPKIVGATAPVDELASGRGSREPSEARKNFNNCIEKICRKLQDLSNFSSFRLDFALIWQKIMQIIKNSIVIMSSLGKIPTLVNFYDYFFLKFPSCHLNFPSKCTGPPPVPVKNSWFIRVGWTIQISSLELLY